MLSAVATPTFVLMGHAAASIKPAVSPGTAPIDPAQMVAAYGVNAISFNGTVGNGAGQTIAIVDAYNDPNIISDASSFNTQWGLQQFNVSGGPTLKVLNQTGGTSLPANSSPQGWDLEESLDVEWAHSIAPEANIILFEANSASFADLGTAVTTAAGSAGVSVVSMSWGGGESSSETSMDSTFLTPSGHQGVTFLASTGDNGSPAGYPSLSPNVVAVGGTTLDINSSGTYIAEGAWSGTGGGISQVESLPSYQNALNGINGASKTNRNVPDVAMDADPNSGVYVLDSYGGGWFQVGGTSLATPMWGGLVAIANQGRALAGQSTLNGLTQTLPTLYSLPSSDFHDITGGSNGTYSAAPGYDLVTGLGTPIANLLVPALAGYGTTQPPTVSAPSTASLTENGSLTFSSAGGNTITVADASAGTNADSLALSVSHGTLTLASTSGLTFTGSNGTASFTVSGTVSNLDAALNGLVYKPTAGYTGSDSLAISITDPGDSLSASTSVSLTVSAPSPPTITAPSTGTLSENGSLVFSTSKGNAITVADASAGGSADSLTLSVSHGTLTLATTSGLTFTSGSNGSALFTVTGTVTNLNAALNGLTYQPTAGYSGSDSLAISIADSGDNLSASGSVGLTIATASPPTITAPATGTLNENGSLAFSTANGNAISVADGSAGSSSDSLTLSVTHGTLTLASTSGLTITAGANGSASVTVSGTVTNLDAALNGLTYKPNAGYSGSDSLSVSVTDPGDGLSASDSIPLTVNATLAPTITAPATASVAVNGSLVFSNKSITVTDASAGSNTERLVLTSTHGTLRLASTAGITFVSGRNASASMTISGTLANLNAALNGLTYTPTRRFTGSASISLKYTDVGDNLTGSAAIAVTVSRTGAAARGAAQSAGAVSVERGFSPLVGGQTMSNSSTADGENSATPDAQTQWAGFVAALEFLIH
jgi:hypothetical protein